MQGFFIYFIFLIFKASNGVFTTSMFISAVCRILKMFFFERIKFWSEISHFKVWTDEHLAWNQSEFDNLTAVKFGYNELWKPDLVVWNYIGSDPWDSIDQADLVVDNNGTVTWDAFAKSITFCRLTLKNFPFDYQTCDVVIGPWMYTTRDVNITSLSGLNGFFNFWSSSRDNYNHNYVFHFFTEDIVFGPYYQNAEWLIVKMDATVRFWNTYSSVRIRFDLQRRNTSFKYYVLFPYFVAVLFAICMFFCDGASGMRQVFAITSITIQLILLMFILYHIGIWSIVAPRMGRKNCLWKYRGKKFEWNIAENVLIHIFIHLFLFISMFSQIFEHKCVVNFRLFVFVNLVHLLFWFFVKICRPGTTRSTCQHPLDYQNSSPWRQPR